MSRRPNFMNALGDTSLAWIAVVIGAVSLYCYLKRKNQPPRHTPTAVNPAVPCSISDSIACGRAKNWKVCLTVDCSSGDMSALSDLMHICQLFVIVKCDGDDSEKELLSKVHVAAPKLPRHQVLVCTSEKALEAFCRQIQPTLLITSNSHLCQVISRFVPYIAFVGHSLSPHNNVLDIPSLSALPMF